MNNVKIQFNDLGTLKEVLSAFKAPGSGLKVDVLATSNENKLYSSIGDIATLVGTIVTVTDVAFNIYQYLKAKRKEKGKIEVTINDNSIEINIQDKVEDIIVKINKINKP